MRLLLRLLLRHWGHLRDLRDLGNGLRPEVRLRCHGEPPSEGVGVLSSERSSDRRSPRVMANQHRLSERIRRCRGRLWLLLHGLLLLERRGPVLLHGRQMRLEPI